MMQLIIIVTGWLKIIINNLVFFPCTAALTKLPSHTPLTGRGPTAAFALQMLVKERCLFYDRFQDHSCTSYPVPQFCLEDGK